MKIKFKPDDFVSVLMKLSKITTDADGQGKNFRVEASDKVHIYSASSSVLGQGLVQSAEIIEPGIMALPLTAIPILARLNNNVTLTLEAPNNYRIESFPGINLELTLYSVMPELISKRTSETNWSGNNYERLTDIIWAHGEENYERDVIWFIDGKVCVGDGIKFLVYNVDTGYNDVMIQSSWIKYLAKGVHTDIDIQGRLCNLGNEDYSITIPIVSDSKIPDPVRQLVHAPIKEQFCLVNKSRFASLTGLTKLLSKDRGDNPTCVVQLKDNKLSIIPKGNDLGSGDLVMSCLESFGEFSIKVNSHLLDAMASKLKYDPVVALTDLYNMELLTLVDQDVSNFLVPLV